MKRQKIGIASRMSQQEEREEDTASKISSDQPTESQPSAFSDAEMTSEPK